jgi:type I restriction enzyme, S subunit
VIRSNKVRLEDICDIQIGRTPSRSVPSFWGKGHPWLSIADMNQGKLLLSTKEQITEAAVESCGGYLVSKGTLVMSFKLSLGKLGVTGRDMYTNEAIAALNIKDSAVVHQGYLYHALSSLDLSESSDRAVLGATLNKRKLAQLMIPLPELGEQEHIADILDRADSLLRKRRESNRLADDFLRSAYLELAKQHTDRASIESVLANIPNAVRTGPFGSQMLVSEFTESGIPVLGIDNVVSNSFTWGARRFVSPEKYAELERYTVRPGDVMVTIMGTTGRVAVVPDDLPLCISTKHLCALSLDQQRMRPFYLWACLRWDPEVRAQTQRESKGAIMEGWNMGIVKGLMVSKPPLDAQLKFEALLARTGRFSKSASNAANETDALIASLSAKYLGSPISV